MENRKGTEEHRHQERKDSQTVTGPGETSTDANDSNFGADGADTDVQQSNVGGRSAGGNAGTGGASTTDVGHSRANKQPDIER